MQLWRNFGHSLCSGSCPRRQSRRKLATSHNTICELEWFGRCQAAPHSHCLKDKELKHMSLPWKTIKVELGVKVRSAHDILAP